MLAPTYEQQRQSIWLHLFLGFIICVAALILFELLAKNIIGNTALVTLDQNVATALHRWANEDATELFIAISLLGLQVLWVVVIVVSIYYVMRKHWAHLLLWLIAFGGAELLDQVLKGIFNRPRPYFSDPLITALNASFPSGHAMVSLVVYGMLAFYILLKVNNPAIRIAVIVATVLLVLIIGVSRIYLGVHYFSDVVAGYVAGVIWLIICINAMNVEIVHRGWRTARKAALAKGQSQTHSSL